MDETAKTEALPPLPAYFDDCTDRTRNEVQAYARAAIAQDRASRGGDAADGVWVPREPTEAMKRAGGHVNSEWLNDNAPIGEARYAMPMGGVWQAMLAAVPSVATGEQSDLGSLDQLP